MQNMTPYSHCIIVHDPGLCDIGREVEVDFQSIFYLKIN
jgi:hypothetical protein